MKRKLKYRLRKFLGLALCLSLAVTARPDLFNPFQIFAESDDSNGIETRAAEHTHSLCGTGCTHSPSHSSQIFQPFTGTGGTVAAGSYYLTGDIALSSALEIDGTVNLCLNGHTISGEMSNGVVRVHDNAVLNLCDCGNGGKIYCAGGHNPIQLSSGGTLNLYGGTVESAEATAIPVGTGTSDASGGCTINIYGGAVRGKGQAILVNPGMTGTSVNIYGGEVSAQNYGIRARTGQVNISGGNILASAGAGISAEGGTAVNLSGKPSISGTDADIFVTAILTDSGYTGNELSIEADSSLLTEKTVLIKNGASNSTKYSLVKANTDAGWGLLEGGNNGQDLVLSTHLIHTYGAPVWSWSGYTSASAGFSCTVEDCVHKETVTTGSGDITSSITTEPTYTKKGIRTYTAKVTFEGKEYSNMKTEEIALKSFNVIFNSNGGTGSMNSQSFTYGTARTLTANTYTRKGYTFHGWNTVQNGSGRSFADKASVSDLAPETGKTGVTLYAQWTANTYTVTFNYQGATGGNSENTRTVTYNSTYGMVSGASRSLPNPAKTGYTFKGWYTQAGGKGNKVTDTTTVNITAAQTLYAYWLDETPPDAPVLTSGTTLPGDWTNTQKTIPLTLKDGVGVTELWVSVDNGSYEKISSFTGGSTNYTYSVREGNHSYRFKAKDAAGNTSEESVVFTIRLDTVKPVIGSPVFENQAENFREWMKLWIIGKKNLVIQVPVTETGSGASAVSCVMTPYGADGLPDASQAETKTFSITNGRAKITFSKDFKGTFVLSCADEAGNISDSLTVGTKGIIVEDTAPVITSDAEEGYYETAPDLQVAVKDEGTAAAGIAVVKYKIGTGEEKSVTVEESEMQTSLSFTIPASEFATGIQQIVVRAKDNAGNLAEQTITVKIKGAEKKPEARIQYAEEKLINLVPGAQYSINGNPVQADGEGCVVLNEDWLNTAIRIVKSGNGTDIFDSEAQILDIPARPEAPAPIGVNGDKGSAEDGKLTGLNAGVAYQISTDNGITWKDVEADMSGEITKLAPGSYLVRINATESSFRSNASQPVSIIKKTYRILLPENQTGYSLQLADGASETVSHGGACTLKYVLSKGYSETEGFAIKVNGKTVLPENGNIVLENITEDMVLTVEGVADITPPEAEIVLGENKWKTLLNKITFGLFFDKTQTVSITAKDRDEDLDEIYYYLADGSIENPAALTNWRKYTGTFSVEPGKYVIYAKAQDSAGNVVMINSEGVVVDTTAPVIKIGGSPAENDTAYNGEQRLTVEEEWLACVTLDGIDITKELTAVGSYLLSPAEEAQTITAVDKAGNRTSRTVTVLDKPGVPDNPDKPDKPDVPDNPDVPDIPGTPDNPDIPDSPDMPDAPGNVTNPDNPETTEPSNTPEIPETPAPEPDNTMIAATEPDKPGSSPRKESGIPGKQKNPEDTESGADEAEQEKIPDGGTVTDQNTDEGDRKTVSVTMEGDKLVLAGETIVTGNIGNTANTETVLELGSGAVIVRIVCEEKEYAAGVADTVAVANAVLTPEQKKQAKNGENIEVEITVKDISDRTPEEDKAVIEKGMEALQKDIKDLVLGAYVDISMAVRIGKGSWETIASTKEPIEIVVEIPKELQEKGRQYYIIRSHEGEYTFLEDLDKEQNTITVSTDRFSTYAIAYRQTEGSADKCGLCHRCPTFLGICYFVWLAILLAAALLVLAVFLKKRKEKEK